MHAPFGDDFAVEVGELLEEPDILQQFRAARAGGHDVLVVGNRQPALVVSFFWSLMVLSFWVVDRLFTANSMVNDGGAGGGVRSVVSDLCGLLRVRWATLSARFSILKSRVY